MAAGGAVTKTPWALDLAGSADGAFCAGAAKHTLLVYASAAPGAKPCTLHHTKPIRCVALSADGGRLAAGDAAGQVSRRGQRDLPSPRIPVLPAGLRPLL